jgi:hypothetical protein
VEGWVCSLNVGKDMNTEFWWGNLLEIGHLNIETENGG